LCKENVSEVLNAIWVEVRKEAPSPGDAIALWVIQQEWETAVVRHEGEVVKHLTRRGASQSEGEDVFQDSVEKLLKKSVPFPPMAQGTLAFMKKIARNHRITLWRVAIRWAQALEIIGTPVNTMGVSAFAPLRQLQAEELEALFVEWAKLLKSTHRDVFQAYVLEELNVEEISARLGLSESRVKNVLAEMRAALQRKVLEKFGEVPYMEGA
jgi:RNA polymerase sigma factor (sigma-70 family)